MSPWSTTFYRAKTEKGEDILDELDRRVGVEPGSNLDDGWRGYLSATLPPEDLDLLLREIDPVCWDHVGKLQNRAP